MNEKHLSPTGRAPSKPETQDFPPHPRHRTAMSDALLQLDFSKLELRAAAHVAAQAPACPLLWPPSQAGQRAGHHDGATTMTPDTDDDSVSDADLNLTDERYLAALTRIQGLVASGTPLEAYDDDTLGNKSSGCTWGLCSESVAAWPDAQDHLWPDQFESDKRVAPKYLETHQLCPLDTREPEKATLNGCFWTCRVFQAKPGQRVTKEQVIKLYDKRIAWAMQRIDKENP